MKKLLGIVVLGLLWCNVSVAGEMNVFKKKIKLPEDVAQGYENSWRFCCDFDKKTRLTPDHAFKIVNKSDDHPVRLGEQSIRFEVRRGDCGVSPGGYDDCAIKDSNTGMTSERHELGMDRDLTSLKGVTWHTYSLFLPKDFPRFGYSHVTMGQFHSDGDGSPAFNWNISSNGGYEVQRRTACNLSKGQYKKLVGKKKPKGCSDSWSSNNQQTLIHQEYLLGKWNDIVFNTKWSLKQDGYLKMWINGRLVYHYIGSNLTPREKEGFQFGIYRGFLPTSPKVTTHVAYYDEIRYAKKSCEKLKLEDLGYSCEELEKQTIKKIDFIQQKFDTEIASLTKEERYVKTLTDRISKKIIITNSLSEDKGKKVIAWVNKELKKWAKVDDEINTIEGRKKKIKSLTKKGIKKFK